MILDTSAIVSILLREEGHTLLAHAIDATASVSVGAPTLVETDLVMVGRLGHQGRSLVMDFVRAA